MNKLPTNLIDANERLRLLESAVNLLIDGKSNAIGTVILTAGQGSTTIEDLRVGADSRILLMPITSNAAAALASTYIGSVGKQTFTISHTNNGQTDRNFKYAIIG